MSIAELPIVARDIRKNVPGVGVPNMDGSVAAGRETSLVGRKRQIKSVRKDIFWVTDGIRVNKLKGLHIPEGHQPILMPRNKVLAVGEPDAALDRRCSVFVRESFIR